jgi:hypothetical protein
MGMPRPLLLVLGVQIGEPPAGQLEDLQGAADANEIVGVEPGGGGGVDEGEAGVQGGASLGGGLLLVARADLGRRRGCLHHAVQDRLDPQEGAATHDHGAPAALDLGDDLAGQRGEAARVEGGERVGEIDEVVGSAGALLRGRLAAPEVEVPVDLDAVDPDDLASERPGQLDRERRLAGGRGAHHDQQFARREREGQRGHGG